MRIYHATSLVEVVSALLRYNDQVAQKHANHWDKPKWR